MHSATRPQHSISLMNRSTARIGFANRLVLSSVFVFLLLALTAQPALAQFSVLYNFSMTDGAYPINVVVDRAGNVYGSTLEGGNLSDACMSISYSGCGTIFKLANRNSNWSFQTLYDFPALNQAAQPGPVTIGPNGTLYGTTEHGGAGSGIVFDITPGPHAGASALNPWLNNVIYTFQVGDGNGASGTRGFTFDSQGNMYNAGGAGGDGSVYELTPTSGGWLFNMLYTFNYMDGGSPNPGFVVDRAGNVYGTTFDGGANGGGVIFELSPSPTGWIETILHNFPAPFMTNTDGWWPTAGLAQDAAGNIYGGTLDGGTGEGGIIFMLAPSNGGWNYSVIYNLVSSGLYAGPRATLAIDPLGILYGTTTTPGCSGDCASQAAPANRGTVFALAQFGGDWYYYLLYSFTGGSDGADPFYGVVVDKNFNLYGTTQTGGNGYGGVFEINQLGNQASPLFQHD